MDLPAAAPMDMHAFGYGFRNPIYRKPGGGFNRYGGSYGRYQGYGGGGSGYGGDYNGYGNSGYGNSDYAADLLSAPLPDSSSMAMEANLVTDVFDAAKSYSASTGAIAGLVVAAVVWQMNPEMLQDEETREPSVLKYAILAVLAGVVANKFVFKK